MSGWAVRRASAWLCFIGGMAGLELTPVHHNGWRLYPLAFGIMLLWALYVAWKDARP